MTGRENIQDFAQLQAYCQADVVPEKLLWKLTAQSDVHFKRFHINVENELGKSKEIANKVNVGYQSSSAAVSWELEKGCRQGDSLG